jgi:hypothetical protein
MMQEIILHAVTAAFVSVAFSMRCEGSRLLQISVRDVLRLSIISEDVEGDM